MQQTELIQTNNNIPTQQDEGLQTNNNNIPIQKIDLIQSDNNNKE